MSWFKESFTTPNRIWANTPEAPGLSNDQVIDHGNLASVAPQAEKGTRGEHTLEAVP